MMNKRLENNNIKAYLDNTLTNIPEDILTKFFILVSSDLSSIMEAIFLIQACFLILLKIQQHATISTNVFTIIQ